MMTREELLSLLYEICDDEAVYDESIDLVEDGLLDSYAMIELLSRLEDHGYDVQPTRIDRNKLRTVNGILEILDLVN
jgi:D-alanine--poly(phosphoribitol) ligase subunit 2